jgi:hypothetical protein
MRPWLLRLYPEAWRRRYGAEFMALLEQQPLTPGTILDIGRGALDAHRRARRQGRTHAWDLSPPGGRGEPARQTRKKGKERAMKRGRVRDSCSFCGKPQDAARRLIAGPGVAICHECVALCNEIIAHDEHTTPTAQGAESGRTGACGTTPWWQRFLGWRRQAALGPSKG